MTKIITIPNHEIALPSGLREFASKADAVAASWTLDDFRQKKSAATIRAHNSDLKIFAQYLTDALKQEVDWRPFASDPLAWQEITWGIVETFKVWVLNQGYAIPSVNRALSTIKCYAGQAFRSKAISAEQIALIKSVKSYTRNDGINVDKKREVVRRETAKKAISVHLSEESIRLLKHEHPDTPQGRRDKLLMCILLDLGLRCGEVAGLTVEGINIDERTISFHRPKVNKDQTHRLPSDTYKALKACKTAGDLLPTGALIRDSNKWGKMLNKGMSTRAISFRVQVLGQRLGISNELSPHDCRHSWATRRAGKYKDVFKLQEAGGWNSLAMPRRYVENAKIANEGIEE